MSRFRNLIHTSISSIRSSTTCKPSHHRPFFHMPISHFTTSTKSTPSTLPDLSSSNSSVLGPTEPNEKPRIVVMGSGWAGCSLMKAIDTNVYDIVCVSTRNHMVFTPLLASTCVGTLEFRSVAIPLHRIQPVIDSTPGSYFFPARCTTIDTDNHVGCDPIRKLIPRPQR